MLYIKTSTLCFYVCTLSFYYEGTNGGRMGIVFWNNYERAYSQSYGLVKIKLKKHKRYAKSLFQIRSDALQNA